MNSKLPDQLNLLNDFDDCTSKLKESKNPCEPNVGPKSKELIPEKNSEVLPPEKLLIVDTETTGLDSSKDKCIEIGAILFHVKSRDVLAQQSFLMPVDFLSLIHI